MMDLIVDSIKDYIAATPEFTYFGLEKIFGISLNVILEKLDVESDLLTINNNKLDRYLYITDKRGNRIVSEVICGDMAVRINCEYDHLDRVIRKYDNGGNEMIVYYEKDVDKISVIEYNPLLLANIHLKATWEHRVRRKYSDNPDSIMSINPI